MNTHSRIFVALTCVLGTAFSATALAQPAPGTMTSATGVNRPATSEEAREEARGAAQDVRKATRVIQHMERRADLKGLLQQAQGVFVVPKFGRAALGIGGQGGVGLLLVRNGSSWSNPAFYNFGGVSAGLQAGAEGGALVLVLNNDKAVNSFLQANNWSLNANAGLTVVNWSKAGQGSAGKGDVTVWSDAKGLYGALNVGITDIKYDADQTRAYYGRDLSARDVVEGQGIVQANTDVNTLKHTLAAIGSGGTGRAATMHAADVQSRSATSDSGMK